MHKFPFLHLCETNYIQLAPRQCRGCWECVKVCPEDVLVKMDRTRHPHVHIRKAQACTGCKKCVRACAYAAIDYTYVPRSSQKSRQPAVLEEHGKIEQEVVNRSPETVHPLK